MKKCTVMVGLPASGKSTFVEDMVQKDKNTFVYSTDAILERIAAQLGKTYNDVFEKHIKSAKTEADIDLDHSIKKGQNIIWDQTNLGDKKRKQIINLMEKNNYNVVCVCFLPPDNDESSEILAKRLAQRPGKHIPPKIIENMKNSYVKPRLAEGFEKITFYNIHGDIVDEHEYDFFDNVSDGLVND